MTDIVYILGNGAADIDDMPLRWSLRSVAKYAKNVGRVIVAGRIPAWLSDEVVKVPTDETAKERGKGWNILYGIKAAVEGANLTAPFLFSADDHYFLPASGEDARHDLDAWPRYSRGELPEYGEYIKHNTTLPALYPLCLMKTRYILEQEGLSVRRAAVHFDTWTDPQDVAPAVALAEKRAGSARFGFEFTSLINAFFEKRNPEAAFVEAEEQEKAYCAEECQAALEAGLPAFSTSDKAERSKETIAWMEKMYGEACKYERAIETPEPESAAETNE